jgi:hypothetical protein
VPNHYGFTVRQWETGKEEMYQILKRVASRQDMITYGDLSDELTSIRIDPHDNAMGAMLGQISEEEDASGRGMLSALVVHKDNDVMPGKGFFDCAAALGRDITDRDSMWVEELRRVYEAWKS